MTKRLTLGLMMCFPIAVMATPAIPAIQGLADGTPATRSLAPSANIAAPETLTVEDQYQTSSAVPPPAGQPIVNRSVLAPGQAASQPVANEKPSYKMPRTPRGRAVFLLQNASPMAQVVFYNGACPSLALPDFRQEARDLGLPVNNHRVIHSLVLTTENGREMGCWYYDPDSGDIRTLTEKGRGEEIALEQLDTLTSPPYDPTGEDSGVEAASEPVSHGSFRAHGHRVHHWHTQHRLKVGCAHSILSK